MSEYDQDIQGHIRSQMTIHLPGLIKVLGEAMYADPWVALRELIQNANDTCTVRRAPIGEEQRPLDPAAPPPVIRVYYDRVRGQLVVEDNGAGMTWDEVQKSLSVIGRSYTNDVREELERLGLHEVADRLIGRFGLGLLSAFIIGKRVEFQTRSYKPGSPTVYWRCDGGQDYEMGQLGVEREVGTRVTVHVDQPHLAMFADEEKIRAMIKRYADLLAIPIYYGREGRQQVNVMTAPWLREATEEEYRAYLRERFDDSSILHVIPVEIDEPATESRPALRVGGALFIPKKPHSSLPEVLLKEYGTVSVYVRRMFVTEDEPKLLPRWAKFVKGVIDSPDLRETTSRESVRHDENLERARQVLGRLILDNLRRLAQADNRLFREIAAQHNVVIKTMAIAEPELFDAVRDIVLFHVENRVMSLATYFKETGQSELPQGQKRTIYYSANTYGVGQHAYLFAERGWRVLDASSYPDEPFLIVYAERFPEAVELVPVDTAGDRVFLELSPKEERWIALEEAFRRNMIEASVVRFEPADIPAVLVDAKDAANLPDDQLERILKADEIAEPVKELFRALKVSRDRWRHTMMTAGAILHLNANSEIIQSLAARSLEDRETTGVMIALYNNALMLSARALTADQAKKIFDGNNSTIKQLMDKSDEIKRLKAAGADPDAIRRLTRQVEDLRQEVDALSARCKKIATERDELAAQLEGERRSVVSLSAQVEKWRSHEAPEPQANYVTCFVMLPFHDDYKGFFEALQRVLETTPYFWQVSRADQEARKKRIDDNVKAWIDQRHCYVAEITDLNGNVMMEVGYAYWRYPERPFLLLCREGRDLHIADLGGAILAVYAWHPDRMDQNVELLRRVIAKQHEFARQQGATHYLSVHSMPPIVVRAMGEAISGRYRTIEQYVQAVDEDVERVLREVPGLTRGLAQDIRDHLVKIAGL